MRFVCCQISNKRINPPTGTLAERFYETFWNSRRQDGYWRPDNFWELPLWIGELTDAVRAGTLDGSGHTVALHIVQPGQDVLPTDTGGAKAVYLFSVLEVTAAHVRRVIAANPGKTFALGGYVDGAAFVKSLPDMVGGRAVSATWFDSIRACVESYGLTGYRGGVDWTLFNGVRCIPRLTLSTGCRNRCRFCAVEKTVTARTADNVRQQVDAMRGLAFELVYLNDKTLGQADNAAALVDVFKDIKAFNPGFRGFIVQTTAAEVLRRPGGFWAACGVVVVEIGMETAADSLLRYYRKPQTVKTVNAAVDRLRAGGVQVIVNILLGLMGETEETAALTRGWIEANARRLYGVNVYTLALYKDAELAQDVQAVTAADSDELADRRTFWTEAEAELFPRQAAAVYGLGIKIAQQRADMETAELAADSVRRRRLSLPWRR